MQQHLSTRTGVEAVLDVVSAYTVTQTPDGLEFATPDLAGWKIDGLTIPVRLKDFLTDLRLLRRIPLSYLVPDPDLLPPESIRFFHVNQTWVDRVIDGVLSNTTVGTVDFHFSLTMLQMIRADVDLAPNGMTGLLIRSELVRRWPSMVVQAYSDPNAGIEAEPDVALLRAEPVSRDVFIALFAGQPRRVHLREPFDGVRYGVEPPDPPNPAQWYVVDHRDEHGAVLNDEVIITPRGTRLRRRLDIDALRAKLAGEGQGDPRGIALHLEQRPFVQVFRDTVSEAAGSTVPPPDGLVALTNGKLFALEFQTQALFHRALAHQSPED